jgi:hypothetical protein
MLVQMTFEGRPAQVMYMTKDFEPVDNELLATLVKVTFLDDEGGTLFLVPKAHTNNRVSPDSE